MKDVVETLRAFVGHDLEPLLRQLEDGYSGTHNSFWREYLRRIRKKAGLPPRQIRGPSELIDLIERLGP